MDHVIRAVQPDEWAKAKDIRLASLQDPAAPVAFLETYEEALEQPDSFWQERAAGSSPGIGPVRGSSSPRRRTGHGRAR